MRIAILCKHRRERARLQELLAARGNHIEVGGIDSSPPDLATYDLAIAQYRDGVDTIRDLRQAAPRLHILALLATVDSRSVEGCISAGADDFMAMRACPEEVVARAGLPARLQDRLDPQQDGLGNLLAIRDAPQQLSHEIGAMFGLSMTHTSPSEAPPSAGAALTLTAADLDAKLELQIGISSGSG